ncbi:MAG: GntR family transcriptional regulator [Desulfobacteraceae bacterium]|jgi:DNA-binding GntR family transcriptional regulator
MTKKRNQSIVIEQPQPMRKQVYEHLRDQILNHTIEPSSRLVEAQIAKEIGISRTPVREALHLLEKDGFVESVPRVGYYVKKLAMDELDEIFEIRLVNEKLACRWAIEKIDETSLKALEKNVAKSETILRKGSTHLFLHFDEEFHEILVKSAGSKHLFNMCQQLRRLMLRYRSESIRTSPFLEKALIGHTRILTCLKNKDLEGLETELLAHLNYSKEDIRNQVLPSSKTK